MPNAYGRLGLVLAVCMVAAPTSAWSQDAWPTKPLRLVVGFSAGGPTDVPARFIADRLSGLIGQRVVVENKTGAAGMLATRDVLAQPRDGYNLLLCTHFESINTAVYRKPGFKLEDLAPISLASMYYYGIAISNKVLATDLESFIRHAKEDPGKISYATIGVGSAQDIFGRQLERLAGIKMTAVPYRGGAQVLPDLIPGRVQMFVAPTANVLPPAREKQLRVIAISSPERLKTDPGIPTLREAGIDFVRFGWLGICAGAGTPQPIIDTLNKHIRAIIASPEYRELIEKTGSIPRSSSPQELRKVIDQTLAEVAETVREFKLLRD